MTKSNDLDTNRLLHILFWVIYFALVILSERNYYSGYYETLLTNSGKFILMILCYYLLMNVLIPLFHKKKFIVLLIVCIVSIYVVSVFNISWRVFFLEKYFPDTYKSVPNYEFTWAYINRLDWMIRFYIPYYFRPSFFIAFYRYIINQRRISSIEKEKTSLELKALKNQLSPHFLFNTMNNIYSLSLENNNNTSELILKLSQILQYIVYSGHQEFVPLVMEKEQIENLIEIESLRHNPEDLTISFDSDIIDSEVRIAPLIILTYVENAFKHGLGEKSENGLVKITLAADHEYITFNIINTIPSKKNVQINEDFQIGLTNLKKQLKILYKNEHILNSKQTDLQYEVYLKLKSK